MHVISTDEADAPFEPPRLVAVGRRPRRSRRASRACWRSSSRGRPAPAHAGARRRSATTSASRATCCCYLLVVRRRRRHRRAVVPAVVARRRRVPARELVLHAALHTFTIAEGENLLALVVVPRRRRGRQRARDRVAAPAARRRRGPRAEAETLAGSPARARRATIRCPRSMAGLRTTFGLDAVAVLRRDGDRVARSRAAVGEPGPTSPRGRAA